MIPLFDNCKIRIKHLNIGPDSHDFLGELFLCFVNSTSIRQRFPLFPLQGMGQKRFFVKHEYLHENQF
jgi:hypothetical protein